MQRGLLLKETIEEETPKDEETQEYLKNEENKQQ